jgi:PEP-CTERM motif
MQSTLETMVVSSGRRLRQVSFGILLAVPAVMGLPTDAMAGITVFEAAGATGTDITAARDAFRTAVGGGSVAGAAGDFGGLRREINWDGVPAGFSDPNAMPANFFNVNSPRGAVFSTPGTGFLVSANAGLATPTLFGFPSDLQAFSAQKLFAPTGSGIVDVSFFVPGTNTAATTSAFGAVFVDADYTNAVEATTMAFFDTSNTLIFSRAVTATNNQGLSFLGGVADAGERISRVRITTPLNFLVSNGVRNNELSDFVVMDDFLYATPAAVPEPEIWAMALLGLAVIGWHTRKRC